MFCTAGRFADAPDQFCPVMGEILVPAQRIQELNEQYTEDHRYFISFTGSVYGTIVKTATWAGAETR